MKQDIGELKTIFVLVDVQGNIFYSSYKDKDFIKGIIDKLDFERLSQIDQIYYERCDCYIFCVEKIQMDDKKYYTIIIEINDNINDYFTYLAYEDHLTGLFNQNLWQRLVSDSFGFQWTENAAVLVIDLDNLKEINDTRGHAAGDQAIQIVGESIRDNIRKQDIGIRFGGDEFLIIIANPSSMSDVEKIKSRIKGSIYKKCQQKALVVDVSVGMASIVKWDRLEEAFREADKKMYEEKRNKKNLCYWDKEFRQLIDSMEDVRLKLNKLLEERSHSGPSEEILKISHELDLLVNEFIKKSEENKIS